MKKETSEIARTKIDDKIVAQLWGVAAGRCEMCNQLLYIDPAFGVEGNYAQNAHIHAVSANGPRFSSEMTQDEVNRRDNLMLLCPQHHKMIDSDESSFEMGYLLSMKVAHENRICEVTGITDWQTSRMVSYIAPIDGYSPEHSVTLFRQAAVANHELPQQNGVIKLFETTLPYEPTKEYYMLRAAELEKAVLNCRQIINNREIMSLFPFGLQPLLIKLGTLLSDQNNVSVYQCHRSGHKWAWPKEAGETPRFINICPVNKTSDSVAIVVDLSAKVTDERIQAVLGNDTPIWHFTIEEPNRDFVTCEAVQVAFYKEYRKLFELIKERIPNCKLVHLFPVMPTSLNVRLGMDYMPKVDLPLLIYDQDRINDGFFPTIMIGG